MTGHTGKPGHDKQAGAEYDARFPTAVCILGIRTDGDALTEIEFLPRTAGIRTPGNRIAQNVCDQLECYLDDPEFRFRLRLRHRGTQYQRAVWSQMRRIPPGRTASYGDIAARLGSSPRAVGQACGANPIPIIVPCHRVVARAGLGGFAHRDDGFPLIVKRWLLKHEHAQW